jgi:hypothetical protein
MHVVACSRRDEPGSARGSDLGGAELGGAQDRYALT